VTDILATSRHRRDRHYKETIIDCHKHYKGTITDRDIHYKGTITDRDRHHKGTITDRDRYRSKGMTDVTDIVLNGLYLADKGISC
jgi:hypothetical protein